MRAAASIRSLVLVPLTTAALVAGCSSQEKQEPPPDPAGTVVTQVAVGSYLDFETGNLVSTGQGGDLIFDVTLNAQAPVLLTSLGAVKGLAEITVYPTGAFWAGTSAAPDGTGLIVQSDQGWAYAVFVEETWDDGSRTLHWRKMPDVFRVLVDLPVADGSTNGFGTVTISPSMHPAGKSCSVQRTGGLLCAEPVPAGATVTITATGIDTDLGLSDCPSNAIRSTFEKWTDDADAEPSWLAGCAGSATCTLVLDQDRTLRSHFRKLVTIDLPDPVFEPKGDVDHDMPNDALVGCDGTTCRYSVMAGTPVTLTATSAMGFSFSAWNCANGGPCQPSEACGSFQLLLRTVIACPAGAVPTCTFTAGAALDEQSGANEWGGTEWMNAIFN